MTVSQYKAIHEINTTTPDTVERHAWIICALFGKEPDDVATWSGIKFLRYCAKTERRLSAKPRRLFGRVRLQTNAARLTFGQFIEVQHWLKGCPVTGTNEIDIIPALDMIAASIRQTPAEDHAAEVERMRRRHFAGILQQVIAFVESQNELITQYAGLFDKEDETPEDEELRPKEAEHPFTERYGWIYAAEDVARLKGIPLDDVYRLPVIEAFNYMAYLKSKTAFIKWQNKK